MRFKSKQQQAAVMSKYIIPKKRVIKNPPRIQRSEKDQIAINELNSPLKIKGNIKTNKNKWRVNEDKKGRIEFRKLVNENNFGNVENVSISKSFGGGYAVTYTNNFGDKSSKQHNYKLGEREKAYKKVNELLKNK